MTVTLLMYIMLAMLLDAVPVACALLGGTPTAIPSNRQCQPLEHCVICVTRELWFCARPV